MKRINALIAMLLLAAMVFTAAACTSPKPVQPGDNGGDAKVTDTPDPNLLPDPALAGKIPAQITDREKLDSLTEFYRFGTSDGLPAETLVITNTDDFERLVLPLLRDDEHKGVPQAAAAKYNIDFFKNSRLVVFRMDLSSGSFVPEVVSVMADKGVVDITVGIKQNEGDVFTTDMAYYLGFFILDKSVYREDLPVNVHGAMVEGKTGEVG